MKPLYGICLMVLLISACRTPENSLLSNYFNTGKLPAQSFTINPSADTLLTTAGGVRIHIGKGSFEGDKPVTIEWKEALQFDDMLRAGLLTQSGKEILSSGGMFYLNTKENVEIQKQIEIDVPTNTIVQGMQLYKGDLADGKIDWQEPKPIENMKAFGENVLGKALFEGNCVQCHTIDKVGTGPALAGVTERKSREWLYAVTHNTAAMMAVDPYLRCERCKYKVVMQAFPALSDEALDSLYDYIEDETERLGLTGKVESNSCDSCAAYHSAYDSLLTIRNVLDATNNNTIDVDFSFPVAPSAGNISSGNMASQPSLVEQIERKTDYYKVKIEATGWFNIDVLLKGSNGIEDSKLIVRLQGTYTTDQEIYLAVPSHKILVQGGYLENKTDIGFYEKNGNTPLPQQVQAFVFAIGEQEGQFLYSQQDFIITGDQTITLSATAITKEQFDLKMHLLDKQGLKVTADTTVHFSSLKSVDEQLEKMKDEKLKNCGCGTEQMTLPADNTTRDTNSAIRPQQ